MPLITLDNISLRFSEKVILDEINATILKGDKIGLIGRNGEGKSSFLKVLAGLIHADDGNLKVKNNTRISYLEQQPPEDNDYSLFNIVARGLGETGKLLANYHDSLQIGDIEKSAQLQNEIESKDLWHYLHQIETILNRFKLEPTAKLSTLSGGWKRRVMLAKAIVQEPALLLLDEPLTNLDAKLRNDMRTEFKRLHRELGMTMVLATPDQLEALTMGERVGVMQDGKVVAVGAPRDLYQTPDDTYVAQMVGSPPINFLPTTGSGDNVVDLPFLDQPNLIL